MRDDEEVNKHSLDGEWIQKTHFQMLGLGNKTDGGNNYQEKEELVWGGKEVNLIVDMLNLRCLWDIQVAFDILYH